MHPERKHIRLRNFDYTSKGQYFITICTNERECFFGNIESVRSSHVMTLNAVGEIANQYFQEISNHFSNALLDEFVIMPNHVHCILELNGNVGSRHVVTLPDNTGNPVETSHVMTLPENVVPPRQQNQFGNPIPSSVSVIIQQFKSSVKRWCNKNDHEYFQWQSRFHEHVIRDSDEYQRIKQYIINNPANWNADKFYR